MKKVAFIFLAMMLSVSVMAQQSIQLRSVNKAECVKSDMTSLKASFSFSSLGASKVETTRGEFSEIYIEGAYPNGNVGEPQLPMFTRLIAIPTGATPVVTVSSHSETQYTLSDYGIGTIAAMQAPVRKNVDPSTVEYSFSEAAYSRNSYNDDPIAMVEVLGTMRGITLGRLIVQPVRYNPAAGTVKVFNDIEVNVDFQNGDAESTEQMFKNTFSPAFISVYDQIFNIDMLMAGGTRDAYTDHPDMYNTPVKMLVICYSGFKNNSALNSWLQWKLQKGYYVDIFYTDETGTTANNIKNFISTKYNASVSAGNAYTYLIVIGDTGQVPQYMNKTIDSSIGECASDLGYASVNFTTSSTTNYFPDMYYSRMSVENTTHLTNYINKVLTYEKFEMTDGGNYLNNVILVGGWDSNWTARVAKPTINYATNYYFKSSNTTYGGFENGNIEATISTSSTAGYAGSALGTSTTMGSGVYTSINSGVGFLNYTAHGDKQEWYQPKMTAAQVARLTNTGKYFFGVGNCCLTGNFNNTTTDYSPGSSIGTNACFAETMIRVPNAGAVAYVGCSPYSYWYEDFYWAVGAHSYSQGNYPTTSASSKGVYDVMFMDQYWNSASALMYLGNLAVQQAVTNGNSTSSITDGDCRNSAHYYFQFYHTFGDGSVMPYVTKPETNTVTIPSTVAPGTTSITVNALAGSYVAVTDNSSVIYGVAEANSSGVATVNFTNSIPGTGTLHVVVTRQQYQPYFGTIEIAGGTQYSITVTQPQHGTISAPSQAYANTTVTLTATPETGYCLSSWTVKKGNTNITVTNNQFIMPEGNVTVTATFVQGLQVTLASVMNGTISADPLYALQGTTINLTATPAAGYEFGSWSVYKTGDPNTTVTVNGNSFTMPNYSVTVSANFVLGPTELTVYDGTTTNQYIPMYGYYFDDFTKSECIIPASALTAMNGCTISAITFYPSTVATTNDTWASTSQTVFLKEVSGTTLGGSFSGTSGATTVKQALLEMPTAGTAYTITFDTPYTYNGGNLLIGVYNTDDGSYNKVEWYGTGNQTSGVSAYGSNGSSLSNVGYTAQSFLPKTTFTYMPTITPYISLTPNAATLLTGSNVTLTATYGNVSGTPSITYTSSNTSVATVSGSGTTVTVTAVAAGTATITASMTVNGTTYTATSSVTVEAPSYCTPSFGSNTDYITNFTLGSINNSTDFSTGGYGDYTSMSTTLEQGASVTASLTSSSGSGTHAAAVWIDFNNNYTFESSERVGTQGSIGASSTVNISLSIPSDAATGSHTMRVVYQWDVEATDIDPCASASYGEGEDYTVTITTPSINNYEITATANPTNGGTVTGAGSFAEGQTCTLIATPATGYTFTNWTKNGTVVSTNANYSFTVTAAAAYVANFTLNSYAITVSANPTAGGTVSGAGTYNYGTSVTLRATANTGYTFTNWTKNGTAVSTNATYSITVTEAAAYVANFTPNSYNITLTPNPAEGGTVAFGSKSNRDELTYDFEDGWQGWTTFQGNTTSPNSWMHNTAYPTSNNNFSTGYGYNNSDGFMLSESYISGSSSGGGTAVTPDNYLVSPQVRLGGSISFYAGARNTSYCAEKFSVMVSTTDNTNAASFTTVGTWTLSLSSAGYTSSPYTVDLSAYSGMGYIAIRHFDCYDQWFLAVDNVTIVEGEEDPGINSGNYNYGTSCTVIATPNTGYYFVNWTENGTAVSSNATYTFTVTGDRDLVANFSQEVQTYTITATANPTNGGIVNGGGTFEQGQSCTLTATANTGYTFTNWTKNGTVVSTNATYSFTVNGSGDYVANFEQVDVTQTIEVSHGWSWWSANIEVTLSQLEAAMGTNGINIVSQNGIVSYLSGYGWDGSFTELDLSQMYEINMVTDVELTLSGIMTSASNHPVTINHGWTWIGYPVMQSMSVNNAFAGLNPVNGDIIKSKTSWSTYNNGSWTGTLNTLEPGQGYMYYSNATSSKTFTYPVSRGGAAQTNVTDADNYWKSVPSRFANNMNVMAVVELDGTEASNDNIEVGAFVGDECRGSVRLMHVENTDRYMAFLTIHGEMGELVSFKVLDGAVEREMNETMELSINAVIGDMATPYVLHTNSNLSLFPNPVNKGEVFTLQMPSGSELNGSRVEVYNALGSMVRMETMTGNEAKMTGLPTSGVYTVKVTDRNGNIHITKLVVK